MREFRKMIRCLTARTLRNAGVSVATIAKQAKVHPSTVHRWLQVCP